MHEPFSTASSGQGALGRVQDDRFSYTFWQKAGNKAGRGFSKWHSPHTMGNRQQPPRTMGLVSNPLIWHHWQPPVWQHRQSSCLVALTASLELYWCQPANVKFAELSHVFDYVYLVLMCIHIILLLFPSENSCFQLMFFSFVLVTDVKINLILSYKKNTFTHRGLVTPYGGIDLGQHLLRYRVLPSYYPKQCWLIMCMVPCHSSGGIIMKDRKMWINKTRWWHNCII